MKLGIFTAFRGLHKYYVRSCEELGIEYELIDIIGDNWLEEVQNSDCDGFLCRPPSKFQERKSMYDEKLYMINKLMNKPIYPSYEELFIYENKKMMYYFMKLNNYPHVETHVFYRKKDFLKYIETAHFPLVFKTNIGSTAKGVEFIKSKRRAKNIANKLFGFLSEKLARGFTPQTTGKIIPVKAIGNNQKHYILVQKFEGIKWEWRIIKIGNSYFGHKKLLNNGFASGSGKVGREDPPKELLYMVKKISEENNFYSLDLDIFETKDDRFLINEIQSIFGAIKDSQMHINGIPGRYTFVDNDFKFEEGVFNKHASFMLRVEDFVSILQKQ